MPTKLNERNGVVILQDDAAPTGYYSFTENAIELDQTKKPKGFLLATIKDSLFSCFLGVPAPSTQGHRDYLEQLSKRNAKRREKPWRHVTITYIE